jgi:hypothetical protein
VIESWLSERLEHRPAEGLHDVDRGCDERALLAERRSQEHHRGHTCLRTDSGRGAEHRAAEGGADKDREHCVRERQRGHEDRSEDDHQQGHAQVRPEKPGVEAAEHPQPVRDRLDAPAVRLVVGHAWRI